MKHLIFISILFWCSICYADFNTYSAKCVNVVDGDTVDLEINMGLGLTLTDRARFLGFDAPETYRPKTEVERVQGLAAKQFLKELIGGKTIKIQVPTEKYRGSFGRVLIIPFYQNQNIIETMKQRGFEKQPSYR